MKALGRAFQFLTRLPVPAPGSAPGPGDLGRAVRWFPLVGLFAGLALEGLLALLRLPGVLGGRPLAAAALALAFWVWCCDSLHLDALADTADALASRRGGEAMLEVLHDSRVGAFGVQAVVLALALKGAWLASLPADAAWALPLPLLCSRLLAALLCRVRPYAGRPGSLSGAWILGTRAGDAWAAAAAAAGGFAAVCALALRGGGAGPGACLRALSVCLGALALGWAAAALPRRRLGGISGDLVGFGLEACEIAAAMGLLLVLK